MVIVYRSNTGFTKQYAEMLAKAEKLKVYPMEQADLPRDTEIFYMGPLMAGRITGLNEAVKEYQVLGACGVGMSPPGPQILSTLAHANFLPNAPMFYLQGGWAPKKVGWFRRRMVNAVTKKQRTALQAKSGRTKEEQALLDMMTKGGSFVAYENLATIRSWMKELLHP